MKFLSARRADADCEWSLILAMVMVGQGKYTRAGEISRGCDARRTPKTIWWDSSREAFIARAHIFYRNSKFTYTEKSFLKL